jgi:UDP-glucose 4-epimerase
LALDDLSSGRRENLSGALDAGAALTELDVSDSGAVLPAVEAHSPDIVFHLAAQIDVRTSMEDPGFDSRINVTGTLNALEASARAGAGRFVFTSTGGAIYGEGAERADELPFSESAACMPFSIYGQSKLAAEGYLDLYRRTRGLPAVALRLGNVYGPRQDPALEAGVVAIFCGLARDGGNPTVFGDGTQTRDYVHVHDVVSALLAAAGADRPGPFNVGTGAETSVLELAETVGRLAGRDDFEPSFEPRRDGEVERSVLDATLAERELGWRPRHDLETGLAETLEAEH